MTDLLSKWWSFCSIRHGVEAVSIFQCVLSLWGTFDTTVWLRLGYGQVGISIVFTWDIITHPCLNLNGGSTKPPFKLEHAWMGDYIPLFYGDVLTFPRHKLRANKVSKRGLWTLLVLLCSYRWYMAVHRATTGQPGCCCLSQPDHELLSRNHRLLRLPLSTPLPAVHVTPRLLEIPSIIRQPLLEHIRFKTQILTVWPTENFIETGRWNVAFKCHIDGEAQTLHEVFDSVFVCSGLYKVPVFPDIPGRDSFRGEVIHMWHYRHSRIFNKKRVLVVGEFSVR